MVPRPPPARPSFLPIPQGQQMFTKLHLENRKARLALYGHWIPELPHLHT